MTNTPAKDQYCRNCHNPLNLHQKYCGHCGQKHTTGHVTIWELAGEFFSTIFNLENKTLATLWQLVKPGRLTRAYFKGQHKRYGHPVRVFFISIVALIALASYQMKDLSELDANSDLNTDHRYYGTLFLRLIDSTEKKVALDTSNQEAVAFKDSLETRIKQDLSAKLDDTIELDNIKIFGEKSPRVSVSDLYELSSEELEKKYIENASLKDRIIFKQKVKFTKNMGNFVLYMVGRASWILIMLLPLLGLVLKLFYIRRNIYFVEHLIFSMHVHSLIFLSLFIAVLMDNVLHIVGEIIWFGLLFGIPLYLFLAMKFYYGQGTVKTFFKFLSVSFIYLVLLIVCTTLTILLGFVLF